MNDKQIKELKEKYGVIYELPVDDKTAYLRAPKMQDFKRAFTAMQDGDTAFGESLLNALFIGGDKEILTDDSYFSPAKKELKEFFVYDDAEIEPSGDHHRITIAGEVCIVRAITRQDLKIAEKRNPSQKPFVTQEKLFESIVLEKSQAYDDKENASVRFPLYQAIEKLQNKRVASLKKL